MQNNILTVHISDIHRCIVKSSGLFNLLCSLYKKYKKLKFLNFARHSNTIFLKKYRVVT
jgi:hypothetical protein